MEQLLTFSLFVAFQICPEILEKFTCFFFMFAMGGMHKKLCVVMDEGRRFLFRALRIKAAVQLVTKPPSPPGPPLRMGHPAIRKDNPNTPETAPSNQRHTHTIR